MSGVKAEEFSREREKHHLLDVREDDEWRAGHIDGAQHIPLGELAARVAELPSGRPIVAVCRIGARSATAVRGLHQMGHSAENLDGGVTAWARAGLPLMDEQGRPGKVI
ncbi:MAG: rhodanese-like domain-containing protein [Chloroflexota bacterium]